MKIEITDISEIEKEVRVEIPADHMQQERLKTLKEVQKKAAVKGFRTGKVPFNVLEKLYTDRIDYDLTDRVIQERIGEVLTQHEFVPVVRPSLTEFTYKKDEPLSFQIKLDIKPKVEFSEEIYKNLKLTRPNFKASDEEITAELSHLQEGQAQLEPAAEGATLENGMIGIIDFEGTIDGKPFKGGNATNFTVEVGKGRMLPEFEQALAGMKAGEKKTVRVQFPEEYFSTDLRGKAADFAISLHEVKKKNLPALDDEFAKDLGQESLDALKEDLGKKIAEQKERAYRNTLYQQIIDQLTAAIDFPIPKVLVEREKESAKRSDDEAIKRLKSDFILEVVARHQNCKVEEQDLELKVREMALMNRVSVPEVIDYYRKNDLFPYLQFQILAEKALAYVLSQAQIEIAEAS